MPKMKEARARKTRARRPTAPPPVLAPAGEIPEVRISARGAERLKSGHVWVYRSDIDSADLAAGALVVVKDHRGKPLGTALYSSSSQIAVRMISPIVVAAEELPALLRNRMRAAIAYRKQVVENTDACRLVFSEADFLPGLIVDRYNEVLCLQILTQGMDSAIARDVIVATLAAELNPVGIVERVEARVRDLEQLPPRSSQLVHGETSASIFTMNGVRFHFDGLTGQKTGGFLDQRENYAAAEHYAHGEALDVFCYQGGFALHLARKCTSVTGVDSSRPALEVAEQNSQLNGREIDWIEANAFDLLKDYAGAGRQYDTIVLDPPAFAKSKRDLDAALRGYKELNLRALKMLRPGGILVTCSCSYHVDESTFTQMLVEAGLDSHRTLRILEKRSQAKDHPIVPTIPETSYLKATICYVV
jgi:23S rRNA (cytosine1962-C5)-methyltransferase